MKFRGESRRFEVDQVVVIQQYGTHQKGSAKGKCVLRWEGVLTDEQDTVSCMSSQKNHYTERAHQQRPPAVMEPDQVREHQRYLYSTDVGGDE